MRYIKFERFPFHVRVQSFYTSHKLLGLHSTDWHKFSTLNEDEISSEQFEFPILQFH